MRELAADGLAIGDSGAATLAALRQLRDDAEPMGNVLLIATEGPTDPVGYRETVR
jgi:threonine dehydratase